MTLMRSEVILMDYVNFIKEYGALILAAVSVVVGVIAAIIKRRPKTLDDFKQAVFQVIEDLPVYINLCEDQCSMLSSQGSVKKALCLTSACNALKSILGRSLSKTEGDYAVAEFSKSIEAILSTPQKKGGN